MNCYSYTSDQAMQDFHSLLSSLQVPSAGESGVAGGDTYTDPLSGLAFVVPEGWNEVQSNVELAYPFQVQFTSQQNSASTLLYGSVDAWNELTVSERSGHIRSDINTAYIYAYEDGALMEYMAQSIVQGADEIQSNAEVHDINLVTYGENEVIEISIFQEMFSVRVPLTAILYVENGYMHLFLFAGSGDQAVKDFHSVLSSFQVPAAETPGPGSTGSGQADETVEMVQRHLINFVLFLFELGVTFLIYALPFVVYRNAIRKRPVNEKVLVLILIVLYEFVALLLLNGAMSWFLRRYANFLVPFIWGWYSYRKMVRGKDTDIVPENADSTAALQQPVKADAPHSAAYTHPQNVSAAPVHPFSAGASL